MRVKGQPQWYVSYIYITNMTIVQTYRAYTILLIKWNEIHCNIWFNQPLSTPWSLYLYLKLYLLRGHRYLETHYRGESNHCHHRYQLRKTVTKFFNPTFYHIHGYQHHNVLLTAICRTGQQNIHIFLLAERYAHLNITECLNLVFRRAITSRRGPAGSETKVWHDGVFPSVLTYLILTVIYCFNVFPTGDFRRYPWHSD